MIYHCNAFEHVLLFQCHWQCSIGICKLKASLKLMDIQNSIIATKQGFENSFSSGDFYNTQTQDDQHLKRILEFLPLKLI